MVVAEASAFLKMAVAGINLMAAMSLGSRVELATDMRSALRAQGVRAPASGSRFP